MAETLAWPLAYLITFTCYGTWLPGDPRGSVRRSGARGTEVTPTGYLRERRARAKLKQDPMFLGPRERGLVDATIREVCDFRGWNLLAINVRTNHVHVLVYAEAEPEKVMSDFKSWSTRRLREHGLVGLRREIWTSHGSTRHLWREQYVDAASEYVVHGQGPDLPMDGPPGGSARSEADPR